MNAREGEELLRDTYAGALTRSATEIGTVMRGLSEPDRTPAFFHRAGGKDRTRSRRRGAAAGARRLP